MGLVQRAPSQRQIFNRPEAADAKGALRRLALIAIEQTIAGTQLLADPAIGQPHPLRIRTFKAMPRDAQQGCIHVLSV